MRGDKTIEKLHPTIDVVESMHNLIVGRAFSAAIYVAAKLGIADLLIDGSKTCSELAEKLNVNQEALYRLMRSLSSMEIFFEYDDGSFGLTPMAETMRIDVENSLRDLIIMCGDDWHWTMWGGLLYTIKTGSPYFVEYFKMDFFPFVKQNPGIEKQFNAAMKSLSSISDLSISENYDFSGYKCVVDIGGGEGGLLSAVLEENPRLKGILFDLPEAVKKAEYYFSKKFILSRCDLISGDFFESIPVGGDLYIIKHVLHGLSKQQSVDLLKKVSLIIKDKGKLIVIEMVVPDKNIPSYSKFNDLGMMLLSSTGRERTEHEFKEIFSEAGLQITQIVPLRMGLCIIEGIGNSGN